MRPLAALVIAVVSIGALTTAHAETTYEAQAQGAQVVNRLEDLVWALTATCDAGTERTEVQARQCRLLRDARAAHLRTQPLIIEAEPGAFVVGELDAAKKSAPTSLTGCIRCTPITVDGKPWSVYAGTPKVAGVAPVNFDHARTFPDAAALAAWKSALGEIRVHYVVKVGAKRPTSPTLALDVVGFRVISACTGEVLASSAPAQPLAPDKRACSSK